MQLHELLNPITWVLLPGHTHRDLTRPYHVRRTRDGWALVVRCGLSWMAITRRQHAPHRAMKPELSEGAWWWTCTRPSLSVLPDKPERELSFEDEITEKLPSLWSEAAQGWDAWPELVQARERAPLPILVADDDDDEEHSGPAELLPIEVYVIEAGPAEEETAHSLRARMLVPANRPALVQSSVLVSAAVLGGLVLLGVLESVRLWWVVEQIARVP